MRSIFVLSLLGVILITIALVVRSGNLARRNPGRPINSAMRAALDAPQFSEDDAAIIARSYGNAHRLSSGVLYVLRGPGSGPTPSRGDTVSVEYEGRLLNGTKFDSSADKGHPLSFRIGVGEVIKGWDEAILEMRKGESRTLIIPYWMAYGESDRGKIPARATLVFDVTLIDFH
jgi:FKBP-type peptidyl-prolyl cis-trans isomerase